MKNYDNVAIQRYDNLFASFDFKTRINNLSTAIYTFDPKTTDTNSLQELFLSLLNFIVHFSIQIENEYKQLVNGNLEYLVRTVIPSLTNINLYESAFHQWYVLLQCVFIYRFDIVGKFLLTKFANTENYKTISDFVRKYVSYPVLTNSLVMLTFHEIEGLNNHAKVYEEYYEGKNFINSTLSQMNDDTFNYFALVIDLFVKNKDYYRALYWCKVYKNKISKINNISKVNVIILLFSLDLVLNEYRDNVFDHDKDDLYSGLIEIRKTNSFKLFLNILHNYGIALNNLSYFQYLLFAYIYSKVSENLKQYKKFRLKDLNLKLDNEFIQIIGQNNLNNYVVQAFNAYDFKRTMTLNKDVIEVHQNTFDLNLIASETEVYKNASQDMKNYRTFEHVLNSTEVLSANQNFKFSLDNLYSLKV
eukprot:Mrub_04136.p1 GENE.Mrub_04136~~Mrub_04136.p1  ORF type:complete len:441 (+),score=36.24 Mrub_04136:74-1324(+)